MGLRVLASPRWCSAHGPGAIQTSLCRGHDLSNFSLKPDTPSCVEGEAAQKALGLCRPRHWRGGGERPAGCRRHGPLWTSRSWPATSAEEAQLGEGLSSPRGAEEVGGRQGAPHCSFATGGTGFLPMMELLMYVVNWAQNKLKNDLLNWNWTELKNNYIFFQLPINTLNEILKWKTKYFFHWSFCLVFGKKKFLIPIGIITLKISNFLCSLLMKF